MRIALIGALGQLGTGLEAVLEGAVVPLAHAAIEITDEASVEAALSQAQPELVINCAAYNLVDKAESEPDVAYRHNALGPRNVARWCGRQGASLLHVSTDFVFGPPGPRSTPFGEDELPNPCSAYAISKLAGEYFVAAHCPRHFIVRTCGLYGRARTPGKGNFVETMLRLGKEKGAVTVVDDQCCTPTAAADLALAIKALVAHDAYGVYHATNSGSTTWFGFAQEIFRQARLDVKVQPTTSAAFGAAARRPIYSVLDNSKLTRTIGYALPDWQDALARYLAQRSAS
jgi:dTDP-4-dehydrorhamnose reductase